ncbi:MAG TPA: hypothetical protein DCZ75_15415 [Geobacter sp.]|nr:hypothetical protein [Geobacter sp.]
MRKQLRRVALFTCITAALAFGSQAAFAHESHKGGGEGGCSEQKQQGPGGARFLKKMARELGLADQQKNQAKALLEKGRAAHKPLLDALMTHRRQLQTLVHSGSADEAAIRAQAAKVAAVESDLAVQRAQEAGQFLALLTAEQATKLKEIQTKRGEHFRGFPGCRQEQEP